MKKEEIRKKLEEGKDLFDLDFVSFRWGQSCPMYEGTWPEDITTSGDEVIYIPDIWLYDLDSPEMSVEEKLSHIYTANDFLDKVNGNVEVAKHLFESCDWHDPSSVLQDLMACTDDEDAIRLYGKTWEEIFSK